MYMTAVLLLAATGLLVTPPVGRATVGPRRAGQDFVMMDMFGGLMQGFTKLAAGSYDEAEVRQALERQIKNRPCVVYSTTSCPFCKKTKDLLSSFGTMFTIVDFDEVDDGMAKRAELAGIVGRTSVPAVFIGGQYVGGCNDGGMGGVLPLHDQGKLKPMLLSAGALAADRV